MGRLQGVLIGLALILFAGLAPFVPSWDSYRGLAAAGGMVTLLAGMAAVGAAARTRWGRIGAVAGCLAILPISLLAALASFGFSPLAGEELRREIALRGGTVYVYDWDEIPDGITGARVAARTGWLPFEHDLLELDEGIDSVAARDGIVELRLRFGQRYACDANACIQR